MSVRTIICIRTGKQNQKTHKPKPSGYKPQAIFYHLSAAGFFLRVNDRGNLSSEHQAVPEQAAASTFY